MAGRALGFAPNRMASRPYGDDPLRDTAPLAGGGRSRVPLRGAMLTLLRLPS